MNLTKVISLIKTILSLIKIYLIIKNKNKKTIFFYFPVKAYYRNIIDVSEKIKNTKKLNIFLIYNNSTYKIIKGYKNSYFLDINYLKFIPLSDFFLKNVNIFISSYINYVFLPKSKNIYISHDITDAPMVNKRQEKKIFLTLRKSHYIFLSSSSVVDYFKKKFFQFGYSAKNIPVLINTGYLKLDKVSKELKTIKNTKNHILLAPTFSGHMPKYNMSGKLELIIDCILQKKEKIIFRPHPLDLTEKGNLKNIQKIIKKYKDNSNFFFDKSHSYIKSYSKAKFLITDLSTTAYTFTYSTLRPVIFFSEKENDISKTELINLCYY